MWSFFVYCTPIADAGILVSLPIKFVLNVKMQITQLFVYLAAGIIIFLSYFFEEDVFHFTYPTRLLHRILKHPFSLYGLIIIVSFVGTMLSAVIEDEIYNYIAEKKMHTKKPLFITYCVITGVCWIIFFWLLYHYHINLKKIY